MAIRIHSPVGEIGTRPMGLAPVPAVLSGRRIGLLDNRKPNAGALLAHVAERLAGRTGAEVGLAIRKSNAAVRCAADLLDRLHGEVDVVLTGSGD